MCPSSFIRAQKKKVLHVARKRGGVPVGSSLSQRLSLPSLYSYINLSSTKDSYINNFITTTRFLPFLKEKHMRFL